MFYQASIPDTSEYMILGYTVSFLVIGLYVLSLYIRSRNLKRDLTTLEEMDEQVTASPASKASPNPAAIKPYETVTKKGTKG